MIALELSPKKFINDLYLPMCKKSKTLYERFNGFLSLAHIWSIGIIEFII